MKKQEGWWVVVGAILIFFCMVAVMPVMVVAEGFYVVGCWLANGILEVFLRRR